MIKTKIFDLELNFLDFNDILEYFKKKKNLNSFLLHIISINPENIIEARSNREFEKALIASQNHIPDGSGVVWAARLLNGVKLTRLSGVDVMDKLMHEACTRSLRVFLIGGKGKLAEQVANCYIKRFQSIKVSYTHGFADIKTPLESEEKAIFDIVRTIKPHIIFVSFGSPFQEIWIEKNRRFFSKLLVMGVGGAFSLVAGQVSRAPHYIRNFGVEWLFRLIHEPWRFRRQLRLFEFIFLVVKEKLKQWF